ncbi:MAG TPA: DoxX family protein [Pseudonocardia sp.]|uniref:DoxX family protein n=1 Tax=Pseudonocardia sp. TaxID=60912 RepID=UPI002B4B363B|nr:DoxX family protein [Pseudonocardia sp.]HLU59636.1 DoxX family protein [Pseudonocardia sp.]
MNRPLPAPARDWALLFTRVIIGVVMFAHGYQKMVINGIGRTTEGFENLSIPLAIVSASFVTVVEFVGSALLILGALTPLMCGLQLIIMTGAFVFVHGANGIFIANGGWELVGVIGAGLVALAAVGPGRYSIDHLVRGRQAQHRREIERFHAPQPMMAQQVSHVGIHRR